MNTPQTTSKGKEKQVEQPPPMTEEQMETLVRQQEEMEQHQEEQQQREEQRQEQPVQQEQTVEAPKSTEQTVPPRQETSAEASILQTPQKEDTSRKRDRETPITTSASHGEKRQRMNPFSEEEMPIGQSFGIPSREASASSFQQEQDRAMGGEVSSSNQQREGGPNIKQ